MHPKALGNLRPLDQDAMEETIREARPGAIGIDRVLCGEVGHHACDVHRNCEENLLLKDDSGCCCELSLYGPPVR